MSEPIKLDVTKWNLDGGEPTPEQRKQIRRLMEECVEVEVAFDPITEEEWQRAQDAIDQWHQRN